jgi:hypothetical protein
MGGREREKEIERERESECLKCDKRGGITLYKVKIQLKDLQGLRSNLQPLKKVVNLWKHIKDKFPTQELKFRSLLRY